MEAMRAGVNLQEDAVRDVRRSLDYLLALKMPSGNYW
jgi:hypothetical protein